MPREVLDWQDELPFGRYRGETVGKVFDEDPTYLSWLMSSTSLRFKEWVAEAIEKEVSRG